MTKLDLLSRLGWKQRQRTDSVFGVMTYMGDKLGYWEGKSQFETGAPFEVFVDGVRDDNMDQQHVFFKQVSQEWPALQSVLEQVLRRERSTLGESIWQNLTLTSMTVPKGSLESAEWEISFSTIHGAGQLFTVHLKGREPLNIVVDD